MLESDSEKTAASVCSGTMTRRLDWRSSRAEAAPSFRSDRRPQDPLMDEFGAFVDEHGEHPPDGAEASATTPENPAEERFAMHAFGAQFADVRVDATAARSASLACSACSRSAGSSTPAPPARS